mmetsp:Transcript_46279/g.110119  ORF Transcript_46279/g.110119 Transcript_46279/m.110119 type:complete len:873 (-) Transcript_46279:231-2849(-)
MDGFIFSPDPKIRQIEEILIGKGEVNPIVRREADQCEAKICEKGGKGLLLPLFGDSEQDWPNGLRVPLYLIGLLWTFLGVAIVADVFMGAIETIVAKKKRKWDKEAGKYYTYIVWNSTIANLTLMALGSSAPEILLGVIEVAGNDFYAGDLGPSTIVGSAAFNLFCISAVCVSAIGGGEIRYIKDLQVFGITAFFSVFAYLWLWFIVSISSENFIDLWESVVTFLFFPVLVILAFLADKGYFSSKDKKKHLYVADIHDISKEELAELEAEIKSEHKERLTDEQMAKIIESRLHVPKTRAAYRVGAIRSLTGAHKIHHTSTEKEHSYDVSKVHPIEDDKTTPTPSSIGASSQTLGAVGLVQFVCKSYVCMESDGKLEVPIELALTGKDKLEAPVKVTVKSRDGVAKAGEDFTPVDEVLTFEPGELEKTIQVEILDDHGEEADECFFLDIGKVHYESKADDVDVKVGEVQSTQILILDDDGPGCVSFEKEDMNVQEGLEDVKIDILVKRKGGFGKGVGCKWATEEDTAVSGRDFEEASGELIFEQGQVYAKIPIVVKSRGRYESVEHFRVVLSEPQGGLTFDDKTDGGAETCIITINIEPGEAEKQHIDQLVRFLSINWDRYQIGHSNWKQQFIEAFLVNGGDDEDGESPPSKMDYVLHVISLPWKVLFAFIPPSDYCGGWLCFCMSLVMIGGVTAIIGDMAGLLGCTLGLPDAVTAITFVALGTSLPDTFASKTAALQDEFADASIGNITGSNSVNVFLGIGISWMAGSIFWESKGWDPEWCLKYRDQCIEKPEGGKFVVVGGDLGTSVIVFCVCALVCLGGLMFRRLKFGGELGGPPAMAYLSSGIFVSLWLIYVAVSSIVTVQSQQDDPCS